ncbi:uncharacterized protein LOC143558785 [Bidens hawaiensis]|uniref:uncharacterized protein LOC143558785 n=1 Tax=Bidens hawaiensis TaxID=980011 RepID=UPI00404A156A
MSAIIPNIPNRNPNPLTDPSQYTYLQDPSAFQQAYPHVGVPMNEATNTVFATTMQPENILPFYCEVCNISCNTNEVLDAHKRGKKHLKNEKKLAEPSASAPQMVPPQSVASENLLDDLESKKLRLLQNGATPETLLLCEICNVICNNQDGFQKHIASKKHYAKAIIQQANPIAVFDTTSASSAASQKKPDTFPCGICKITCSSNELLKMHIAGKKHLKKVKELGQIPNLPTNVVVKSESDEDKTVSLPQVTPHTNLVVKAEPNEDETVNLPSTPIVSQATPPASLVVKSEPNEGITVNLPLTPIASQDTPPVKSKTVNLHGVKSVCELCGIICDTDEMLKIHLTGRKHRTNVAKSEQLIGPKPALTTEPAETPKLIGPVKEEGEMVNSSGRKRKNGKGGGDDDVEAKKQRVLQSGTASDSVKVCTLCNVVCNSRKVFESHLAGQKHVAMAVKQVESQAGATGQQS